MAFVMTEGQLAAVHKPGAVVVRNRVQLTDELAQDYATLWRTQPQIRTVVSFLGRNIAQIGCHVYERISDTDRKRLGDHPLGMLLSKPNPRTTRYRLFDSLVQDVAIFDNAFWMKLKGAVNPVGGVVRVPPSLVTAKGDTWMWPDQYVIGSGGTAKIVDPDQIVHFRGYNPEDSRMGVSPMETLRRILAEEYQAGVAREQLWRNGARFPGYIQRPKGAGDWSDAARRQFSLDWNAAYTGTGSGVGGTPILEDDMEFKSSGITPSDAQYLEARKLTREEVAAAYHIPLPMVGILDHATFSNIKEQHQNLYQDTLGPWLKMIEEELELQLLGDFGDTRNVYVEFNLQEKMKGSFEEQAASLQTSVGGPWLTRNEARARQNLPQIEGGDELITPLNVIAGGQASPTDSSPKAGGRVFTKARPTESQTEQATKVLRKFFRRQRSVVLSALGGKAGDEWWDQGRWDSELSDDLHALALKATEQAARDTLKAYGQDPDVYSVDQTAAFLLAVAKQRAGKINSTTKARLDAAVSDEAEDLTPADVFDEAEDTRSPAAAGTLMTTLVGFATTEAGKQASGGKATKTWEVTSGNPRPSHAELDGETVGIDEPFSNGAMWPGDSSALDVDDVAGCTCSVTLNFP